MSNKKNTNTTKKTPARTVKKEGVVFNCERLNVRQNPGLDSKIIYVLKKGSSVKIDPTKSVTGWHFITLEDGAAGFCMKKFIK